MVILFSTKKYIIKYDSLISTVLTMGLMTRNIFWLVETQVVTKNLKVKKTTWILILIFGFCTMWDCSVWTRNFAKMESTRATTFIRSQQHVLWKVFSMLVTHPVVIGMEWAPTGVQWVACLCNLQQWPQYLLLELPNIVRSFRRHSAVAARLTSEVPGNVIPVLKH